MPSCLVFTPSCTGQWALSHALSKVLIYQVDWTWQNRPSFPDREGRFPDQSEKGAPETEDVSWLKCRPLCGPSYPAAQAGKTSSPFPFSTGNTLPARSHHSTCLFPNFILLVPQRHLVSPKPSLFLLCHFQACRYSRNSVPSLQPCTTHSHVSSHFHCSSPNVATLPVQFSDFFTLILYFDVNWKRHQSLHIFNGNSLMNI